MRSQTCQACSTRIFFGRNVATGKFVPLDATPVDAGAIETKTKAGAELFKWGVYRWLGAGAVRKVNRIEDEPEGETFPLYRTHFETCSKPGRFSKNRRYAK